MEGAPLVVESFEFEYYGAFAVRAGNVDDTRFCVGDVAAEGEEIEVFSHVLPSPVTEVVGSPHILSNPGLSRRVFTFGDLSACFGVERMPENFLWAEGSDYCDSDFCHVGSPG